MYKRTRSRSSNAIPQKRVEKVKLAEEPVPGPSGVAKKSPPTADLKRAEVTKIAETAGNVTRRKMEPSIFDEQEWEKSAFKKKQSTKPAFHAAFNDSSVTCDFLDQEKAQSDFFQILEDYRRLHRLKNNVNESVDRMSLQPLSLKEHLKGFQLRKEKQERDINVEARKKNKTRTT